MSTYHYLPLDLNEVKAEINAAIKGAFSELKNDLVVPAVEDKIFTILKAADILNVSVSTIHNYRKEGLLQSGKVGGRVCIRQSDIDQCIVKLNIKNSRS